MKADLDSMGNPIRTTETEQVGAGSEQFVTTRKFDALGRILSITDPGNHTISSSYDEPGHVVSSTDALGNVTKLVWDGAGRKTDDQMPESRNIHYDFDGDGLLLDEKDGLGNVTQMTYDEAGRKTTLTFPDGKSESWVLNPDGTVATHKNANSYVETYTYDGKDRPVRIAVTKQGGIPGATYEAYAYDALDRITHEETDSATGNGQKEVSIDRSYGNAGALLSETENGRSLNRTLGVLGRTTALQIPGSGVIGRTWDAIDRIASITLDNSSIATFGYRGPSRIDNVVRGTGVSTQASYDPDRRLTGLLTKNATTNLLAFGGGYDARHLLTSEDRGGVGDAFGYDKAGRLTQSA